MTLYANRQKDGMNKLIGLAKALCRLVLTFAPVIRAKFPDSAPIIALIDAIEALCPLISEAELDAMLYSGENDPIVTSPENTPGIDPSAPPAPDPSEV
jgi:hypothetical protein